MEKDSSQQPQAVFSSNQIGRKGKTNYFTNVKHKRTAKETAKQLNPFKGKRKFITIPVLVVLVIGIVLLVLYLTIWRHPVDNYVLSPENEPSTAFERHLADVYYQANNLVKDDDCAEAIAYIDKLISESGSFEQRIQLIFIKSDLYAAHEKWEDDLKVLLGMDSSALGDEDLLDYEFRLSTAYEKMGDSEAAQAAEARAEELMVKLDYGGEGGTYE